MFTNNNTSLFEGDVFTIEDEVTYENRTAIKEGYIFNGWYGTNTETGDKYSFDGSTITIPEGTYGNIELYVRWDIDSFKLIFDVNEGDSIDSITYQYGKSITTLPTPFRNGYDFEGWYHDGNLTDKVTLPFTMPASDKTIYAKWIAHEYTISFEENGGNTVFDIKLAYKSTITGLPTANDISKQGYTFGGWYYDEVCSDSKKVKETDTMPYNDITLYAKWTINTFTITWVNWNDEELYSAEFEYGVMPSFVGETPTRAKDAQYTYTFKEWSPNIVAVKEDAKYTATYNKTLNTYKVTWKNENGDVLETDNNVSYGTMPSYNGDTPTKAKDAQYTYSFKAWSPNIDIVKGDVTYTATYNQTLNTYTIIWKNDNGDVLETDNDVPYNSIPEYNGETPTKQGTAQYNYVFNGWDKPLNNIEGNITFTATYTANVNTYTVTWKNDNGDVLETDNNVPYNSIPEYNGETPTKSADAQYTYTFNTWTPAITNVTSNIVYTATYFADANQYTITFDTDGGTEIDPITQDYGTVIDKPINPIKEGYIFNGWDVAIPSTMPAENMTITATWEAIKYSINYTLNGGTVSGNPSEYTIETETFKLNNPTREGWIFVGWTGSNGNDPQKEISINVGTMGNLAYIANWDTAYTITFNSNNGTEVEPIIDMAGSTIEEINYMPTRAGYVFDGWYRDNNTFSQHFKLTTMPAENITLYAKWISLPAVNNYLLNVNEAFNNKTIYDYLNGLGYIEGKYTIYYNGTQKDKNATISSTDAIAYSITVTAFTNASESTAMLSSYDIGFVVIVPKATSDYNIAVDKSNNAITVDLIVPKNSSATLFASINNYVNENYNTYVNGSTTSATSISSGLSVREYGVFSSSWTYYTDKLGSLLPGGSKNSNGIPLEDTLWNNAFSTNENTVQFVGKTNSNATFTIKLIFKQNAEAVLAAKERIYQEKYDISQLTSLNGDLKYYVTKENGYIDIGVQIINTKSFIGGGSIASNIGGAGIKTLVVGGPTSSMESIVVGEYSSGVQNLNPLREVHLYSGNKKFGSLSSTDALAIIGDLLGVVEDLTGKSLSVFSAWRDLNGGTGYAQYKCIDNTTGIIFMSDIYYFHFYR